MSKIQVKRILEMLPISMSVGALTIPWVWLYVFGPNPTGDEGGAAHIFQLLTFGQLPIILYFFVRYFTENKKETLKLTFIQVFILLMTFIPVYVLDH